MIIVLTVSKRLATIFYSIFLNLLKHKGTITRLSFNIHGARMRVINNDNNARNPMETLTISSCRFKLKKADIKAIPKVIKETINIFLC